MLLENKVAVITGSAVGIGRGIAIALAREGANIIALDINAFAMDLNGKCKAPLNMSPWF